MDICSGFISRRLFKVGTYTHAKRKNIFYIDCNTKRELQQLIDYLNRNNVSINLNKSVYIQFNQSNNAKYNVKMNIDKIDEVTLTKFLGVTLDQDINWKAHIDTVSKRINKFVYALKRVRNITNIKTAITSYHAYVESVLRYGLIMWGNSTHQNRAFISQKKMYKSNIKLLNAADESCRPYLKNLKCCRLLGRIWNYYLSDETPTGSYWVSFRDCLNIIKDVCLCVYVFIIKYQVPIPITSK